MFTRPFYALLFSLVCIGLATLLRSIFNKKNKGVSPFLKTINILLIGYISFLFALTLIPFSGLNNHVNIPPVNLIPVVNTVYNFSGSIQEVDKQAFYFVMGNTIGNLLIFIPLGILLPFLGNRYQSLGKVFFIALLSSLLIETTQLSMQYFNIYRICDIDDVILNTLGACVGFMLWNSSKKIKTIDR